MPIIIPDNLPARQTLEHEGVVVISEPEAIRQDIRPMRVALLNLMPEKIKTETQLTRLIGATPLQVEMTLITTSSYTPKNTSADHLLAFYRPWDTVRHRNFDGLIITGAPVETMPFEQVQYWHELTQILNWSQTHVQETLNLCWGAQASLYHFHKVPKHNLSQKMFGVYPHRIITKNTTFLRGFNDVFPVPVSRHSETRQEDIATVPDLYVLASSDEAGLCIVRDPVNRQLNMLNHLEYEHDTLAMEYQRDVDAGAEIQLPAYYFPNDDPDQPPVNFWRPLAHLLFANWINYLYQTSPFEVAQIPHIEN
ncbi:MAG: homoserine O-succinyltransferase [Pseudomonadota bacterium]|nr:homoserine O-succinyltransferase [Pseudomonadota bacterium]